MSPTLPSLKRAAVALVLLNAFTVAAVVVCFESARHFQERSEQAVVSLANDMTQVSQAKARPREWSRSAGHISWRTNRSSCCAHRRPTPSWVGRCRRSRPAPGDGERRSLEPLLASAKRYRDVFSDLLSGKTPPRDPRAISESLRKHLIPAREDSDRPAGVAGDQEARRAGRRARAGPPWSRAQPRPDARSLESWAWPRASFWRLSSVEAAVSVVRTWPNRSDRAVAPVGDQPRRGAPP